MQALHVAFLGGGPGPFELAIVLTAVLLLFGAKRLPEFARTLGRVMHELRRASQDFRDHLMDAEHRIGSHVRDIIDEGDADSPSPDEPDPYKEEDE